MTLTATATTEPSFNPPRVRIDLASTVSSNRTLVLMRTHADGSEHRVVVERGARLSSGEWAGFDYLAPLGESVKYRAVAGAETSAFTSNVTLSSSRCWLLDPSDPLLGVRVEFVPEDGFGDTSYESAAGVFTIIGSDEAVSVFDRTIIETGSVRLGFLKEQLPAVRALLRSGGPLLLSVPVTDGFDVHWEWLQRTATSFKVTGKTAGGGNAGWPFREVTIGYTVTGQPLIDLDPVWTCALMGAAFASCTLAAASFDDCIDMATDARSA